MDTRAIAYIRVSTDKQATGGVSLAAQRAKVEAYAALYDLELVEVVTDAGVSAKRLDRPGLSHALARIDAGEADALLVVKLDRLTRSVRDLDVLISRYFGRPDGPALLSVSEQIDTRSAAGRLVLNVLASVSQWEREAIGERTAAALRHKRERGEYTGGRTRYGFRRVGDREVAHVGERRVISQARNLRDSGLSYRAVSEELASRGHFTRKGTPFTPAQIRRWCVQPAAAQAA